MSTLPFRPELIDRLRARFPEALRGRYDVESIRLGSQPRPTSLPRHVFDFKIGVRIGVSVDDFGSPLGVVLHVSGSVQPNTEAYQRAARACRRRGPKAAIDSIVVALGKAMYDLGVDLGLLTCRGLSEGGVVHWTGPVPEVDPVPAGRPARNGG